METPVAPVSQPMANGTVKGKGNAKAAMACAIIACCSSLIALLIGKNVQGFLSLLSFLFSWIVGFPIALIAIILAIIAICRNQANLTKGLIALVLAIVAGFIPLLVFA